MLHKWSLFPRSASLSPGFLPFSSEKSDHIAPSRHSQDLLFIPAFRSWNGFAGFMCKFVPTQCLADLGHFSYRFMEMSSSSSFVALVFECSDQLALAHALPRRKAYLSISLHSNELKADANFMRARDCKVACGILIAVTFICSTWHPFPDRQKPVYQTAQPFIFRNARTNT